jgi:hypothetical protein
MFQTWRAEKHVREGVHFMPNKMKAGQRCITGGAALRACDVELNIRGVSGEPANVMQHKCISVDSPVKIWRLCLPPISFEGPTRSGRSSQQPKRQTAWLSSTCFKRDRVFTKQQRIRYSIDRNVYALTQMFNI